MNRPRGGNRSLVELLSVTLILLVLPLGLLSLFALEGYERYLGPELRQQADTVGRAVVSRVERALGLGIPLDQLVGVDEYLAPIVHESDSLGFIALRDADGRVPTFTATELEIRHSNAMIGLVSPYFNVGRFAAFKAEQILVDGETPAEIPIETLSRFSYLVKMPVVHQVGLYPPMAVLDYAEIIE